MGVSHAGQSILMKSTQHQRECQNNRLERRAKKLGLVISHYSLSDGHGGERQAIIVSRNPSDFICGTYEGKFESANYLEALAEAISEARDKFLTPSKKS
jgi:hypothetical protein